MYMLSLEIAEAAEEPKLRDAAAGVVRVLKKVVDRPIASAHRLREAQRQFGRVKICCAELRDVSDALAKGGILEGAIILSPLRGS